MKLEIKHKLYNKFIKRLIDIVLSFSVLVLFFWLYVIVAILVKINLGSPIIFVHERPGRIDPKTGKEQMFRLYKFRSMTNETDEKGELLPGEKRMTSFGKMLRKTSLDEIPEIWNILRGDMSFVGPRPWNKKALPYYTEEEHQRHLVRPGLTGLAQVNGRNSADWDTRLRYDLDYVRELSLKLDIMILWKTVINVVKHKGVQEPGKQELFWVYRERQWNAGIVPKPNNEKNNPNI